MSDKTELTRYTAPPGGGLFEDADGPLVWGEDADTLIASLRQEIANLTIEKEKLRGCVELNLKSIARKKEQLAEKDKQIEAQRELMREAATCVFEVCPDLYDRLRKATKAGGE